MELATFDGCQVTYLTRADWGAGPLGAGHVVPPEQFRGWVKHHSGYGSGIIGDYLDAVIREMQRLQHARPDLGNEVPYSAVSFRCSDPKAGVICEGRGPNVTGAHTAGLNSSRLAWCAFANLCDVDETPGSLAAERWLATQWTPTATVPTIGHNQAPPYYVKGSNLNATACPCDALTSLDYLQPPFTNLAPIPPAPPEDPMATPTPQFITHPETQVWWLFDGYHRPRQLAPGEPQDLVDGSIVNPERDPVTNEIKPKIYPRKKVEDWLARCPE